MKRAGGNKRFSVSRQPPPFFLLTTPADNSLCPFLFPFPFLLLFTFFPPFPFSVFKALCKISLLGAGMHFSLSETELTSARFSWNISLGPQRGVPDTLRDLGSL